jgi:hypothetical protein
VTFILLHSLINRGLSDLEPDDPKRLVGEFGYESCGGIVPLATSEFTKLKECSMRDVLVLGIDLASRRWDDIGTATLYFSSLNTSGWNACHVGPIRWPDEGLTSTAVALAIDEFAVKHGVSAVSVDGPQGWRSPTAGDRPGVGRNCEYETRTPGKTGAYGICYPRTYLGWVTFSIEVFTRLLATGRAELVNGPVICPLPPLARGRYYLLECFPTSTWRAASLVPLPGKGRCQREQIERYAVALRSRFGLPEFDVRGHHDHLQAVVAALPAAAVRGGPCDPIARGESGSLYSAKDVTPEHRIEGLIWDARPRGGTAHDAVLRIAAGDDAGVGAQAPDEDLEDVRNPLLPDERDDSYAAVLDRGVKLFRHLVKRTNAGESVGIGYAGFVCFLYGVNDYGEVRGRSYKPGDTGFIIRLASLVMEAAGGRPTVTRGAATIEAAMDTFIWPRRAPHDRSLNAWNPGTYRPPYSREAWQVIFPNRDRRLITVAEGLAI